MNAENTCTFWVTSFAGSPPQGTTGNDIVLPVSVYISKIILMS